MGSIIGKAMDDNMKKQQEFMLKTQQLTMERQIQMQNQMREKMMAMQIARGRDLFYWYSSFYGLAFLGCLAGFRHRRNPGIIAPLVPLTIILGYQWDLAFGNKLERMREEADRILDNEISLVDLPHGLPTMSTIEAGRLKQKDTERLTQIHDIFL